MKKKQENYANRPFKAILCAKTYRTVVLCELLMQVDADVSPPPRFRRPVPIRPASGISASTAPGSRAAGKRRWVAQCKNQVHLLVLSRTTYIPGMHIELTIVIWAIYE